MTVGFGFCPQCGTPLVSAAQQFCAGCGNRLTRAAAAPAQPTPSPVPQAPTPPVVPAPPVAPALAPVVEAWQSAPANPTAPTYTPPPPAFSAPPAYAPPPAYGAPPSYPGAPGYQSAPAAPAPARAFDFSRLTPNQRLFGIGGVILAVVIVGALIFTNMNSGSGGITFSPSTLSCSTPVTFTTTGHLPASVHAGDILTVVFDGKTVGTSTVGSSASAVTQQADGSWLTVNTTTPSDMQQLCASGGSAGGMDVLTPGTHTMKILDATGKVLAQGSYTVNP